MDLPRLLVLPRHITFDFLPDHEDATSLTLGPSRSTVLDLLKAETLSELSGPTEPGEAFVGELTVTLCEARNLGTWNVAGLSNQYCQLSLGDHVQESKKNDKTSHPAGPADPVWNQVKHVATCHLAVLRWQGADWGWGWGVRISNSGWRTQSIRS